MRLYDSKLKYKNIYSFLVNDFGYLGPDIKVIDKSLHPFLIGHRNKICYLDILKNVGLLKDSFNVLCGVISDKGKVLFVGGDTCLVSVLLCLSKVGSFNINVIPWDFSEIRKKSHLDLIILHEVDKMSIMESDNKFVPLVVLNGINIRSVSYPCNVYLGNPIMSNWYLYSLINSCRKGFYLRNKIFNEI